MFFCISLNIYYHWYSSGLSSFVTINKLRLIPKLSKILLQTAECRWMNVKWKVFMCVHWLDFNVVFCKFMPSNLHANCVRHKDLGMDGLKKQTQTMYGCTSNHANTRKWLQFERCFLDHYEPISFSFSFDLYSIYAEMENECKTIVWECFTPLCTHSLGSGWFKSSV